MDAAVIVARALHSAVLMAAFGGALFPLYAGAPARSLRWALALALPTCLVCMALVTAAIGGAWASAFDPHTLSTVFFQTGFGHAWLLHLGATAVLVAAGAFAGPGTLALMAAVALASLSGIGHTAMHEGWVGAAHRGGHALHLLAAGAWLGGLAPLRQSLRSLSAEHASTVVARFSRMGIAAVVVVAVTGALNAWMASGMAMPHVHGAYGSLLALKVGGFTALLAIAALNRLRWSRPLDRPALTRAIWIEQGVFAAVLLLAAALAQQAPGA